MSCNQYAFLDKSAVPTREAWQAAVNETGFDLTIDPELKPLEHEGFLPCTYLGKEWGVETYYDGDQELLDEYSDVAGGKDYCISFRWSSSFEDSACAMILCLALAKSFGAIVTYEGEPPYTLDTLLSAVNESLEEAKKG